MCGWCYGRLTGFLLQNNDNSTAEKKNHSLQPPVVLLKRLPNHEYFFLKGKQYHVRQASFESLFKMLSFGWNWSIVQLKI